MPVHLTNYLVMLPLLALIVWRRVSRQFGRQPIRRRRMIARIAILTILGGLLALSGLHQRALAEGLLAGVLVGAAIGLLGLRLTRFEVDPVKGDCYVPNPWIGALLTAVLLGRLAWRMLVLLPHAGGSGSMLPTGYASTPLTMLAIGLLVGYYIAYFSGLLIHHRRFQRTRSSAAAT